MLVSFPSVSTGLNANAKEFVPSFSTSPPPSPPSQNDHHISNSPIESSFREQLASEHQQPPVFRHPPAVSPFPRLDSSIPLAVPRRQPRTSSRGAPRTSSSQFFTDSPAYHKPSVRAREAYPHSNQSRSRPSAASSLPSPHPSSSAASARPSLKNTVHSLLRSWHVRGGTVGRLLVLRGLPGSGKSTTASLLSSHAIVCSVDRFFPPGENFDQKRMKDGFKACKQDFYSAVNNNQSLVILDNVNCERWQYEAEIEAARRLGYSVRIWEFQPQTKRDLWTCWERNKHGISQHQFMTYYRRWEADPNALPIQILHTL